MPHAVITKSGSVVRTKTSHYNFDNNFTLDIFGKLHSFEIGGIRYQHCYVNDKPTVTSSGTKYNYLNSYYNYEQYLDYKASKGGSTEYISEFNFANYNDSKAQKDDLIIIDRRKFNSDYSSFSHEKYTVKYDGLSWYTESVPELQNENDLIKRIDLQDENSGFSDCAKNFYKKHCHLISSLSSYSDSNNISFITALANTPYVMTSIIRDIFISFPNDSEDIQTNIINSWGNLEYNLTNCNSIQDIAKEIFNFYNSIDLFRNNFLINKKKILQSGNTDFINFLIELAKIADSYTLAFLDIDSKLKMLIKIAEGNMTHMNQLEIVALKLIKYLPTEDISYFFNRITDTYWKEWESKEEALTLFEVLYGKIDDNRSGRYTFGVFSTDDNRKDFIKFLYEHWKKSKYNPYYKDPSYTQPAAIEGEVYPESHFMKLVKDANDPSFHKSKYYGEQAPPILSYELPQIKENDEGHLFITGDVNYTFRIKTVNNTSKIKVFRTNSYTKFDDYEFVEDAKTYLYGTYDILQPISVIGFTPDFELAETFANTEDGEIIECVPIFLLYYLSDFRKTKLLHFGIILTVEIAMSLTPLGNFSKLKYLQYLSKARNINSIKESVAATRSLYTWKGFQTGSELLEFTAGTAASINNYILNTSNDSDQRELANKLMPFYMISIMGSVGFTKYSKYRLANAAEDVYSEVFTLQNMNKPHYLSDETLNIIKEIKNGKKNIVFLGENKIKKYLGNGEDNNVISWYNKLDINTKINFYTDFQSEYSKLSWQKFNQKEVYFENWKSFSNKNIPDRIIDVLTRQKLVEGYKRYYNVYNLEKELNSITAENRVLFIEYFGDVDSVIFAQLKYNPKPISSFNTLDNTLKIVLKNNEYFWIICKLSPKQIATLESDFITKTILKIKGNDHYIKLFTNPNKKDLAFDFLNNAERVSLGKYIENPTVDYTKTTYIPQNKKVYLSVDFKFKDIKGNKVGGLIREIDGLIINKQTGKIENIISCKIKKGLTNEKASVLEINKLYLMQEAADEGEALQNFINTRLKKSLSDKLINKIVKGEIEYIDASTGKQHEVKISEFQKLINQNYDISEVFEISPETFNTTRKELVESAYHRIIKEFKNK